MLSDLDEVTQQCNELHQSGRLRTLIGVGGDGTAAELVNRTPPGIPLTILPSGNENLLARHFRLGSSPEKCRQDRGRRAPALAAMRAARMTGSFW